MATNQTAGGSTPNGGNSGITILQREEEPDYKKIISISAGVLLIVLYFVALIKDW